MTVFVPRLLHAQGASSQFTVDLDARHPYLDHHRPGGAPLFGSTMNVEVMVAAALAARPGRHALAIERVGIHAPYILHDSDRGAVTVRTALAADGARADCTVVSFNDAGSEVLHAEGQIRLGAARAAAGGSAGGPTIAPAAEVYELFFHGPAFQVIAHAQLTDGAMVCGFARAPGSYDGPALRLRTAPRLLEFCLQTAGLLELALSGRMMIPHRIGRIAPLAPDAVPGAGALVAVARRRDGGEQGAPIDIDLMAGGVRVLRVDGYETVALPFAAAAGTQDALRQLLSAGRRLGGTASG